eukprot:RCo016604
MHYAKGSYPFQSPVQNSEHPMQASPSPQSSAHSYYSGPSAQPNYRSNGTQSAVPSRPQDPSRPWSPQSATASFTAPSAPEQFPVRNVYRNSPASDLASADPRANPPSRVQPVMGHPGFPDYTPAQTPPAARAFHGQQPAPPAQSQDPIFGSPMSHTNTFSPATSAPRHHADNPGLDAIGRDLSHHHTQLQSNAENYPHHPNGYRPAWSAGQSAPSAAPFAPQGPANPVQAPTTMSFPDRQAPLQPRPQCAGYGCSHTELPKQESFLGPANPAALQSATAASARAPTPQTFGEPQPSHSRTQNGGILLITSPAISPPSQGITDSSLSSRYPPLQGQWNPSVQLSSPVQISTAPTGLSGSPVSSSTGTPPPQLVWTAPPPRQATEHRLRSYQKELLEQCTARNCVVFCPTGAGKTLIAVALAERMLSRPPRAKPIPESSRKGWPRAPKNLVVFLARTKPLIEQQGDVFESSPLNLRVRKVSGEHRIECWKDAYHKYDVIVCIDSIFLHALKHTEIAVSDVDLLIFDEAHNAVGDSNYARIMKYFYFQTEPSQRPHVLGMTASFPEGK